MKKIFWALSGLILLGLSGCGNDQITCESSHTGSITFSNPTNGFNLDSTVIFLNGAALGMVRLNYSLTVNGLPAGKSAYTFKYHGDTIFVDSINVEQCMTGTYTINWNPISDKRLKQNIRSMNSVLASVLNLNTYTFEYNRNQFANYNLPQGTHYGFMAQDLQKDFPNAVVPYRDGYYAVNYYEMVPVLTKAIQEQQTEIDQLKKEVEELKSMVSADKTTALK